MKTLITTLACIALLAGSALADGIDGKWTSERKMERDGQSMTIKQLFDLKTFILLIDYTLCLCYWY